ncbi:unnamed protein product [Prunus armeniaca]
MFGLTISKPINRVELFWLTMMGEKEEEPKAARGAVEGEEEVEERSSSVLATDCFVSIPQVASSTQGNWSPNLDDRSPRGQCRTLVLVCLTWLSYYFGVF